MRENGDQHPNTHTAYSSTRRTRSATAASIVSCTVSIRRAIESEPRACRATSVSVCKVIGPVLSRLLCEIGHPKHLLEFTHEREARKRLPAAFGGALDRRRRAGAASGGRALAAETHAARAERKAELPARKKHALANDDPRPRRRSPDRCGGDTAPREARAAARGFRRAARPRGTRRA